MPMKMTKLWRMDRPYVEIVLYGHLPPHRKENTNNT